MYSYEIEQDTYPENPRSWDNACVMACWHRGYDLGDNKRIWDCPDDPEDFVAWAEENKAVYLPLYLYDHSGITMSTSPFSCRWDSGQVGYVYLTRKTILKEWGWKVLTKKRIAFLEKYMRDEVETYDQYLTGDVYGYVITDDNGEEVDSCWGFYGHDYCEQEAKSVIASREAREPKQFALKLTEERI